MKKKVVAIIMLFTITMVTTTAVEVDDDHDSSAIISDTLPVILDSWIVINDGTSDVWDSSDEGTQPRSAPYIWEGETLKIFVRVFDPNGEDDLEEEYVNELDCYLDPSYGPIDLIFVEFTNDDETQALYLGEFIIPGPDTLRCAHRVYLDDDNPDNVQTPYEVFIYLYINPEVTPNFDPTSSITWSSDLLIAGATNIDADDNPYIHSLLAECENTFNDGIYEPVAVDYLLSIYGTDMTSESTEDFIPVSNIQYSIDSVTPVSLLASPTPLGSFVANTDHTFDFDITIPVVISSGTYNGDINFVIDTI